LRSSSLTGEITIRRRPGRAGGPGDHARQAQL